jgi:hypothetical protein
MGRSGCNRVDAFTGMILPHFAGELKKKSLAQQKEWVSFFLLSQALFLELTREMGENHACKSINPVTS